MAAGNVARIVLHVIAVLILLAGLGCTIGAFMSTGWQIYEDPGTGEIHQHGLWLDNIYDVQHVASKGRNPEWIAKPKFGQSVHGDEPHRAKDYHINTLIMLCVATVLAIAGCICACCATRSFYAAVAWAVTLLVATLLCAAAVITFYLAVLSHRFVTTDKKIEQYVGYSFLLAIAGAVLFAISMLLAIAYTVLAIATKRKEEQFHGETRPAMLTPKHHITSL